MAAPPEAARDAARKPAAARATDGADRTAERRRASRSLWQACEALLAAPEDGPRVTRALDTLRRAFDCDGVAIHHVDPAGELAPWCAIGRWRTRAGDLRDCLTVPLLKGAERLGALDLMARPGQRFRPSQLSLVRTASGALGAALAVRLELERLRRQPGRDPVTGLPDEGAFVARLDEELGRARTHGLAAAVALVELDHFGALIARFGRGVSDQALAEAALVMKLALREGDLLARLSGARFAMLLPETEGGAALRCAERVRRAVEEHRFGRVTRVSAAAGAAACPRDGLETVEIMDRAAKALALARKSGHRRAVSTAPAHVQ